MAAVPLQRERDEVRFERLYREHAGDVYRYALAIMRNPADAEDVTQATFLNAWRAFSAGEEPRVPLNWFIAIAHNVCRLRFRTRSRRPQEVEFEPALAEAPLDDGPSASDVLDALAELPVNQRAALVLRELEGRSYGEIATTLGVSRSAVETLIFRARRSLRIRRDALRTLAVLPLPQSLASFFRARGVADAGAAAVLGSGLVAKAVAVIATGVVAAGAAHEVVRSKSGPDGSGAAPSRVQALARSQGAGVATPVAGSDVASARRSATGAPGTAVRTPADPRRTAREPGRLAPVDEPAGTGATDSGPAPPGTTNDPPASPGAPEPRGTETADPAAPLRRTLRERVAETTRSLLPPAPTLPAPPALPDVPDLPAVPSLPPVNVPPLPPVPPELPALPAPPPLPPVSLPPLPPPPPLPKLP